MNTSSYEYSRRVKIRPSVGRFYATSNGVFQKKTLILGGSHYADDYDDPEVDNSEFTDEIVTQYLEGGSGSWKSTFSKFINSVFGTEADQAQREQFFESVAFYNYLQEIAGGHGTSASLYDYKDSRNFEAFCDVIEELRPEVVISWGAKVWNALPNEWTFGPAIKRTDIVTEPRLDVGIQDYPFQGGTIRLIGVKHPSGGFEREGHHALFRQLNLLRLDET